MTPWIQKRGPIQVSRQLPGLLDASEREMMIVARLNRTTLTPWLAGALSAWLAAIALVLTAAPAIAHSELVSSSPADGETLSLAPISVTLQFNEAISPAGLQVVAQGPDGPVTLGTPIIDGASVVTPWPAGAPGGDYRFAYRVVSADGHPIDGNISFSYPTIDEGAAAAAPPEPVDLGQSAIASENTAAPVEQESGFPWWVAVVAVILGVGIGAAIARTMRARATKSAGPQG